MHTQRTRRSLQAAVATALAALALGLQPAAAGAGSEPGCAATGDAYTLGLRALTGPQGADLAMHVAPAASTCARPETLKKVHVKTFALDGSLASVRNLNDLAAPDGTAGLQLGRVERGQRLEVELLVQPGDRGRTHVVRGETTTLLRPDLAVTALQAPPQTLTTRPTDVAAEIGELNGDTAATATVTLSWGPTPLATRTVEIPARGRTPVTFAGVALTTPTAAELTVRVSDVEPAETDSTNDSRSTVVEVTEFELAHSRLLVSSLGGYGAQFNQHVFAKLTPAPPGSLPDLEAKVKALDPQLVRVFFNEQQETQAADRMASFIETVELADEAGASINVTYQSAARAKLQPDLFMKQFAAILDDLVRNRGFTNVRWVTIQNEPNSTLVTLAQYEALNRAIDAALRARGLRDQIGIMAGDLVENGGGGHRVWMHYIADHMNDIVDAYSEHIYWNYWDIPRMEFRLRDVHHLVTEELPPDTRKPTYIAEYGVRGIRDIAGKPVLDPGYWQDGTQIARTNIAAFQQLWFNVLSAQLGFSGTSKWDAYWGKYDNGNQAYWMIGPAEEGWPLFPAYHALRLLLQTTERGWQVLGVDPWSEDDWRTGVADQPEKELTAYAGPNGELTLIGIDTHARDLNVASPETPTYSVGGLPAYTRFNLAIWNAAANGEDSLAGTVTTNAAGVARFDVPLQGAFALTTEPVS